MAEPSPEKNNYKSNRNSAENVRLKELDDRERQS